MPLPSAFRYTAPTTVSRVPRQTTFQRRPVGGISSYPVVGAGLLAPTAPVPVQPEPVVAPFAAAAGALAAIPAVPAGAGAALLAAGAIADLLSPSWGMFQNQQAGGNIMAGGVEWRDIFGLGRGDVTELTGSPVAYYWDAKSEQRFYRTQDGRIHTFKKNGQLSSWRPKKPLVLYRHKIDVQTLLSMSKKLDNIWAGINRRAGKYRGRTRGRRTTVTTMPAGYLSPVEYQKLSRGR